MALTLQDRIHGCWLGKSIGGTLGLPAEGRTDRMNYTFYDPVPEIAPPNDDLELQLVWLDLLEKRGFELTQRDFADAWLASIHYMWDEYGRCRWNLRRGIPLAEVGTFENPFVSGMGSPIRSEIWACLCPGQPALAARYAAMDASLDHGAEGIDGEVYLAVLQSLVLSGIPLRESMAQAFTYIRSETETARALLLVTQRHRAGTEAWACREQLLAAHRSENFTHAPLNLGLIAWALLYGEGDFEKTILLAVNGGYDTDCTAATAGATVGLAMGAAAIPKRWQQPIGEGVFVGPGILDIAAPSTLTELTERTRCLSEGLRALPSLPVLGFPEPAGTVNLETLPGTIRLQPLDGGEPAPWANGELPDSIKRTGGATWWWDVDGDSLEKPHWLVGLARAGARLWVDGEVIVDCPAGVPYVPAPHRCAQAARALFRPKQARHSMRVELHSRDVSQEARVILTAGNLHLKSWAVSPLPHAPKLPSKWGD